MNINKLLFFALACGITTSTIICNKQDQTNPIESQFTDPNSNPFVIVKEREEYIPQKDKYYTSKTAYKSCPHKLYCNTPRAEGIIYSKEKLNDSACKDIKYMLYFLDSLETNKKLVDAHMKFIDKENKLIYAETVLMNAKIEFINENIKPATENKKLFQFPPTHDELTPSSNNYDDPLKKYAFWAMGIVTGIVIGGVAVHINTNKKK
jgi:hypothetical protein